MTKALGDLIQAGEGYHLEFKESPDKSFLEEVCAFANSGGGKIIIGLRDDGAVKGIATDNRSRSIIQDALRSLQPNLDIRIDAEDVLFVVNVPEGREKPYACPHGFYIRNGANSQKLTRNEIVDFFQKEGRIHFDELSNDHASFKKDFDETAFLAYLGAAGISATIDRAALLKNLNCLTDDGKLTNAGVLFFAKNIDFILNNAIVVCVLYKGTEKITILDKKDFKGNIVENIKNAVLFAQRHTNLEYVIKTLRREEVPDIPEVALRETIINAVCHRDYFDKRGNVLIEVFSDRVVISNPGGLPGGLSPEEFGTKSVVRNHVVASLLQRIDFIEKVGTGIGRIRNAVARNGKTTVEFAFGPFFTVTFRRKLAVTQDASEKTSEKTSEKIIELIQRNPEITIQDLSDILHKSSRAIEMQLSKLKEADRIVRIGPDKGGRWETTKKDTE